MAGLYPNDASMLDTAGRLLIVALFLILGLRNLTTFHTKDHIAKLTGAGTPMPAVVFWCGLTLQFTGVALVLLNWHPAIGVMCFIVFTVLASALFHRFWQSQDVGKRTIQQNGMCQNFAVLGGLLLLLQNVR